MKNIKIILNNILNIVYFLILFIGIQIPTLAELPFPKESLHDINLNAHIILLFISSPIMLMLTYLYASRLGNKLIFFKRVTLKNCGIAVLGVLGQNIVQRLLEPYVGTNGKIFIETLGTSLALVEIVTLCLISPILEEMLFQGAIQKGLFKKLPPFVSTLLTAIIFSFSHGYGISLSTLSLFAPCLAFGIVYQLTDDIKMPILCHSLSNIIALIN